MAVIPAAWRRPVADPWVAAAAAAPALADLAVIGQGGTRGAAALAAVLVPAALLVGRREHPVRTFWLVLGTTAVLALLAVVVQAETSAWTALPTAVAVLTLAAHLPARSGLAVALSGLAVAALVAGGNAVLAPEGYRGGPVLLLWVGAFAVAWALGAQARAVRVERELGETRAAAAADNAVREERARIARDLHDVASHHLTQLVVRAEGLRARSAALPDWVAAELADLAEDGRRSTAEMRATLRVLRADGPEGAATEPLPGLAVLPALLDRVRRSGTAVELDDTTDGAALDPAVLGAAASLTAYRVIQEGLTNVQKHADGAPAVVRLAVAGGRLRVVVENPPGAAGPGSAAPGIGLAGLRERVASAGGEIAAEPLPDGGFRLAAVLPAGAS